MNIAQTYLEMTREQGISDREATRQICDAIGIKFFAAYANQWTTEDGAKSRPIPPAAVKEMQRRAILYAAQKVGIKTTGDKAERLAELIAPKVTVPISTNEQKSTAKAIN